jgi:arabinofuranosyltransferase
MIGLRRQFPWRLAAVALALVGFVLTALHAWLSDDAFITLRTVDNLLAGRGWTWNPGERVQTYTHPLWMLVLAGAGAVTGERYFSIYGASLACSAAFLAGLVLLHGRQPRSLALALLALTASKSFVDFGTGGLENPLLHVLLCVAYWALWELAAGTRQVAWLSLLTALGALTRLDALLLFVPAWCVALARARAVGTPAGARPGRLALAAGLGFFPLVAWEGFSLVYYGFLLPNTFYAKLATDVPWTEYALQGGRYVLSTSVTDPLAILLVLVAVGASLWSKGRHLLPAAVACVAWLVYMARIGGDFMVGRHFTPAIVLSAMIIARTTWLPRLHVALAAAIVAAGILAPLSPWKYTRRYDAALVRERLGTVRLLRGIGDERSGGYPTNGLFRPDRSSEDVDHPWASQGRRLRAAVEADPRVPRVHVAGATGMMPFFAGPAFHIVDPLGLGDPLLARIPRIDPARSRVGHYCRFVPEGYLETLATGENRIADPDLAAYYDELRLVVSSPDLWSARRLEAILGFATGRFDSLRDAYVERGAVEPP